MHVPIFLPECFEMILNSLLTTTVHCAGPARSPTIKATAAKEIGGRSTENGKHQDEVNDVYGKEQTTLPACYLELGAAKKDE